VSLHAQPKQDAKVIAKVNISQHLIPFYQQKHWVKVANPKDGKVGWVNREAYKKAMHQAFNEQFHTTYIEVNQNDQDKPRVTAFKNGKQLPDKDAQKLYKKMQKQQHHMQIKMHQYQKHIQGMLDHAFSEGNAMFANMPPMPILQPVVIVEHDKDTSGQKSK
jgi:hypothetical protein